MSAFKRTTLVVLGALFIAVAVLVWKYATTAMTSLVENAWCSTIAKSEACRFRGYQHMLIWTTIGIMNLLVLGLVFYRLLDRP